MMKFLFASVGWGFWVSWVLLVMFFSILFLFEGSHLKGLPGPFVLGGSKKKIEADLTHVGLNSDHVRL